MIVEFKLGEIIFVSESAEEWMKLLKAREKLMGKGAKIEGVVNNVELNQTQRYLAVYLPEGQSDFSIDEDKEKNTFEVEIRI